MGSTTEYDAQFGKDSVASTESRKYLHQKVGNWYLYCFFARSWSDHISKLVPIHAFDWRHKLYVLCSIYFVLIPLVDPLSHYKSSLLSFGPVAVLRRLLFSSWDSINSSR